MRVNLTQLNLDNWRNSPKKIDEALQWLNNNLGVAVVDNQAMTMIAERWQIFAETSSVEGFYESTHWLEFQDESDCTLWMMACL